jgi:acyl carrier protein
MELRSYLKARLPNPMIPSSFVLLENLPRTTGGKVDRQALPAAATLPLDLGMDRAAPRSGLELWLAQLWESALDKRPIGVRDDFFDIGGHSLLAAQVIAQINSELGADIPTTVLFQQPTIEQLAEVLRECSVSEPDPWQNLNDGSSTG